VVAWEITRRCPLRCRHCRAGAEDVRYEGELTTKECMRVLDNIAGFASPIVILTGGEPMSRGDFLSIVEYGSSLGLRMAAAPCGPLVTDESAEAMKAAGIKRISLSLDGVDAGTHDAFRGFAGSFESVLSAAGAARRAGLEFQINTTFSSLNLHQLDEIIALAERIGAVAFHPFLLVPTGRGEGLREYEISAEAYEETLHRLYEKSLESGLELKPTCAPHYYRVFRQREKEAGRTVTPQSHGLAAMTKGCLGGQGFVFLSHTGKLQICGFLDIEAGDLRGADFDFASLWREAPLFRDVRRVDDYGGKCGICEYRRVCGGCRARAYAATGDYMAKEPRCSYVPQGGKESGEV
jgi:heme b synthase